MSVTKIAQVDVGSGGAATISFTGIAATFTDLILTLSCRNTGSGNSYIQLQMNSVTSGYETRILRGESGVSSTTGTAVGLNNIFWAGMTGGSNLTASTFTSVAIYIPNYAGSTAKTFSSDYSKETNDATYYENGIAAGSCSSTAAITSLTASLFLSGATFAQYSSATLYGISNTGATGATVS